VLSFCKFLLVSEEFCKEHIHYLFDLLEIEGLDSKVKGNILIAIGDLYKRFTNTLESHNQQFFQNLHSTNSYVRRHCFRIISHLALNDMIKIRGEISDICMLLKDTDLKIVDLVKLFLHEINSKNKDTIFTLIP
jgi:condensin complex subunit 1